MVFGINTNQESFKEEITKIATSIKKEFQIDVDREKVITEFCNQFDVLWNHDFGDGGKNHEDLKTL